MILKQMLQGFSLLLLPLVMASSASVVKDDNCVNFCGNKSIPFPFGVDFPSCSHTEWFKITCNHTSNSNSETSSKPFLSKINLEVLNISLSEATITVNIPIAKSCNNNFVSNPDIDLDGSPFVVSPVLNRFMAVGCDNLATLTNNSRNKLAGCLSVCDRNNFDEDDGGCYGINCCHTTIPLHLTRYSMNMKSYGVQNFTRNECKYAFLVSESWFPDHNVSALETRRIVESSSYVPVVLNWGIKYGAEGDTNTICDTVAWDNDISFHVNGSYTCNCPKHYSGNPYLRKGFDNCSNGTCHGTCRPISSIGYLCIPHRSKFKEMIIGVSTGIGTIILVLGGFLLFKAIMKRRMTNIRKKIFKQNGGLLLQQQMSTEDQNIERTQIFTLGELEKATDYFNPDRVLGHGSQGTVYKGMLANGTIIAIKKSKIVNRGQVEQFINEVVILSQINHRNVVKLLGCCLETEVPLLAYEFVPNGTLFQHIHNETDEFPMSWETRLRIATEVANSLAYLHSATHVSIYHRDIKSSNILLDDKYRAKVSDFGTSRSIPMDQTHVTTLVHGTFGYLDPEYFQSCQLTEKSDVYSFGVVLVELLTSQPPVSWHKSEEERSLVTVFLRSMEEHQLFDIINPQILEENRRGEVVAVANLARECLNLSGKKRPTMKDVVAELERIQKYPKS